MDASVKPATDIIIVQSEDMRMDVCQSCREATIKFVFDPDPRRGKSTPKVLEAILK
jgi:hypothetical protein